jgi:hypothetical protein
MPTPNQTTPDSLGRTPRTDIAESDGWSGDALAVDPDFARQLERELNASQAEITRLAEALKEAEAFIRECAEDDLDRISPGMKSKARALLTPAPISGAKKE